MGALVRDLGVPSGISPAEMKEVYARTIRHCLTLTNGNRARAEDIAHRTMLKVIQVARKTGSDKPLLPYLLRAANNEVINDHRARARLERLANTLRDVSETSVLPVLVGSFPAPNEFARMERQRALLAALDADDLQVLEVLGAQRGTFGPRMSRTEAATELGLRNANAFDARVEKLNRKITRVVAETGIDLEIPTDQATRPTASEDLT